MEGSENAMSEADRGTISSENGGNAGGQGTVRRFRRQRSLSNKGVHQAIGLALRAHFDDIIKTPMPDTLMALLAELEAKERREEAKASLHGVGAAAQGGAS